MKTLAVNVLVSRCRRGARACLVASCALLFSIGCASTDPFHVYRAPDGTVLLSHVPLAGPQIATHKLQSLDWEEFNRSGEYVYVWDQGDVAAALTANKDLSAGDVPVFSGEP